MSKIVLTEKQKEVLQKQLYGSYSPFFASEQDQTAYNEVIDKADALVEELDAYDSFGEDLMAWFWGKYQEQEQQ